jgi:hypothetical protein
VYQRNGNRAGATYFPRSRDCLPPGPHASPTGKGATWG